MQNAAQTYGNVAKQISSPRKLEADLLLKAASRLQSVHDSWADKKQLLDDALRYNRELWAIFLSSATDKANPMPADTSAEDRAWAAAQGERMKGLLPAEQKMIVDTLDIERLWALSEWLGEESVAAAAHRAAEALELAQLGLRAARRIPVGSWRSLNEGLAMAYLGNAYRVGGSLPAAREALGTAKTVSPLCAPVLPADEVVMPRSALSALSVT